MDWPELTGAKDHETLSILHLCAQMLGKIRVAHSSWINHGWHVALQPVADGFETLPTAAAGSRTFTLRLDLCRHALAIVASDGSREEISLELGTIAEIHSALVASLDRHDLPSDFNGTPNEIENAVSFATDTTRRFYDRQSARRVHEAFAAMLPVFENFRASFSGKSSPVQLWWGSFDLAVSRFNGARAPLHGGHMPGLPDRITREAYSHEVASGGFWASGVNAAEPFFYSYIYPEPEGYRQLNVAHGHFDETFGEFVLPYKSVQQSADPQSVLRAFLQSAYEGGANLAQWNRSELEREPTAP